VFWRMTKKLHIGGKTSYNWVALPLKKNVDDKVKLRATIESGSPIYGN
jgi:hypothetical protein